MTRIEIRFLANRYHGTGWGRHVNEGVPEWPPSPYRLLRGLYDVWKRKCSHLGEDEVRDVFAAIAGQLPQFWLPKGVSAHTRSYLSSNTGDSADKSLIFDAFIAVAREPACVMEWACNLNEHQKRILRELLDGLNYLGRSESWVEARLGGAPPDGKPTCRPAGGTMQRGELVYLACPVSANEYGGSVPWLDALTYSSGQLTKERLSGPPAMRTVAYELDADALATWLPSRTVGRGRGISAAVLELHGPVLPMATDTVRVAERIRGRLMRQFEESDTGIPALIHGKDSEGHPLKDHSHVFILPRANEHGRIESVLLFSHSVPFDRQVIDAVAGIGHFRWLNPVRATAAWMGRFDDLKFRRSSRTVVSTTPFITVRHWRKGRDNFLGDEIRRECKNHGLPEPASVELLPLAGRFAPVKFRRNREEDAQRPGYALKLTFDRPVQAPFALGYGCHFGLGQFDAERR